jgi:hypothetical protein
MSVTIQGVFIRHSAADSRSANPQLLPFSYPALLFTGPLRLPSLLRDQFQRSMPKAHERTRSSFSTVLSSSTSAIRMKKSTGVLLQPGVQYSGRPVI